MTLITRIYTILMLFCSLPIYGQKKYDLTYKNASYQDFIKNPKINFKDSISAFRYLNDLQNTAISKGYILTSIDTIDYLPNKAVVSIYLGEKYKEIKLNATTSELNFLRKNARLSEKIIARTPLTPNELSAVLNKILSTYLNNGYPFAAVSLKNHKFNRHHILEADLAVDKGPFLTWKTIKIKGDTSVSIKYISNLLNIQTDTKYVENEIEKISERIQQVPFIRELKPAELLYTNSGVEVYLYIETIPISSINGIVGFQPDPLSGKLAVTGELNLKLLNVLKRGELLDIKWQSIRDQTQSLNARINYPFLFNTPFGIDGTFELYKRDSSFLELNSSFGVEYYLNKGNVLKAFYQNISSDVLSGGLNNPTYTKLGGSKSNNYGLSFYSRQIDYLPNPSKGYSITISGSLGNRTTQINDTTLKVKSITYRGDATMEFFIPLKKRHVFRLANIIQFYSATQIFENELYRFGGLTSQRGFDEDELLSTTKNTTTLEYRFLLDKNSHVFAFFDQSWYENNSTKYYNDNPYGFGLGFSFSTNFGVFSISYALGKQLSNPILLSNSKVHFGYIVYF